MEARRLSREQEARQVDEHARLVAALAMMDMTQHIGTWHLRLGQGAFGRSFA